MASNAAMAALAAALLAAGCATPVGVKRIRPEEANRQLTASVLTTGQPGAPAQEFLYRLNLSEQYREDPAKTIAELHAGLGQADESSRLFALAELSFDYAEHGGGRSYYLASAAYAWAFLFPDDPASRPGCYDPRVRTAMDLYNRGVAQGLATGTGDEVDLSARSVALPYGSAADWTWIRPVSSSAATSSSISSRWRISRFADCATATAAVASARRSPPRCRRARGAWIRGSGRTSRCPSPRCSASTIRAAA